MASVIESAINELTKTVTYDFLVLRDHGLDSSRTPLPAAGGPDSKLSVNIAKMLQSAYDSELTLLSVDGCREAGEQFP